MGEGPPGRGIQSWLTPSPDETEEQRSGPRGTVRTDGRGHGPKTTSVDVSAQIEDKLAALREHVTQLAADHFFLALTADEWRQYMPNEDFTLSESLVTGPDPGDDLFAGLPAEERTDAARATSR